jgi:hypothetical protein
MELARFWASYGMLMQVGLGVDLEDGVNGMGSVSVIILSDRVLKVSDRCRALEQLGH